MPAVNVGHAGLDVLAELELLAALADLDRAQLTGPVVDILEEVAMDGAEMSEVKGAVGDAASASQYDEASLLLVQKFGIGCAEPVSQDRRAWIDVRVVRAGHFTRAAGLRARM